MSCRLAVAFCLLGFMFLVSSAVQHVDTSTQKLFGHSIKNGHLVENMEITLFEHTCNTPPCAVTQMHCPTAGPKGWESSLLQIYVDNANVASIQMTLLELANVGKWNIGGNEQKLVPWGISLFGHTAANGGVYSTVRIPFGTSIKLTLTSSNSGTFWFIVRGLENYATVLGDLVLPATARLQVVRKQDMALQPKQLTTLAELPNGTAGALLSVKLDSTSKDYNYLEACMRAYIDGSKEPLFLSSGAEDYFLSAFYFNEKSFKTPESGLTYFDGKGTLSAYKVHDRDPILFNDGFSLVFRNCEDTVGCGNTSFCPNQWCSPGQPAQHIPVVPSQPRAPEIGLANYSTTVFVYTWPTRSSAERLSSVNSESLARCPGGTLDHCTDLCPDEALAFKACARSCGRRCGAY